MEEDLSNAVQILRRGGIILYPTDTVWGIGCDARDSEAIARIYRIKKRADSKAMISLVGDEGMLHLVTGDTSHASVYTDRPTTMVYPAPKILAHNLCSEDGSAAIRLTREEFSRRLCQMLGAPIVSTSANVSGHPTARTFQDIEPEILVGVDYVCLTGRDYAASQPSRVVKIMPDGTIAILRE